MMKNSRFVFAVFSDLHYMAWKESNAPVEWVPELNQALMDANALGPDAIVFNGDLTNGKERDFELAMNSIRTHIQVPTHFTMGNHEYYGYYEDTDFSFELAQGRFLDHTAQSSIYKEIRYPHCTFLLLSTEGYGPDWKDAAWLSEQQLTWFEARLLSAPKDKPVFVFLHQPINDTVAESNETCFQTDELRRILRHRSGVIFISGHTHCRMDLDEQLLEQDGTLFVGGGCAFGEHPQSRWFEVSPDQVVIRIRNHKTNEWIENYEHSVHVNNHSAL